MSVVALTCKIWAIVLKLHTSDIIYIDKGPLALNFVKIDLRVEIY